MNNYMKIIINAIKEWVGAQIATRQPVGDYALKSDIPTFGTVTNNLKNIFELKGSSDTAVEAANAYTDNALSQLTELPSVTASDSGKFLRVSNDGFWAAETIPNALEETF